MRKSKGMYFSVLSIACVCAMMILMILYVFDMKYDTVTGGAAEEMFLFFPNMDVYDYDKDLKKQEISETAEQIIHWAKENQATVIVKSGDAVGMAIADYSGWLKQRYGVNYTGEESKTALVKADTEFAESFVKNGTLFPETFQYQIVGNFQEEKKEGELFQGRDLFYYSLKDYESEADDDGWLLHIYIKDRNKLDSLKEYFGNKRMGITYVNQSEHFLSFLELLMSLMRENMMFQCMLLSVLGGILCALISTMLMYRENKRILYILHLYGATYRRLFFDIGWKLVIAALTGISGGMVLSVTLLNIDDFSGAVENCIKGMGIGLTVTVLIHIICYFNWYISCCRKKGRY